MGLMTDSMVIPSKRKQRLGDLLAGTLVVSDKLGVGFTVPRRPDLMNKSLTDYQIGNKFLVEREYEEAIRAFLNHAGNVCEDAANAFERVAECHIRFHNDRKAAEQFYRKALALNPNHFRALSGLAHVLPVGADERLAVLERAVAVQPNYLLLIALGDFYRSVKKDNAQARRTYEAAWRINPKDKSAYQKLWSLCAITGDKADSELWSQRWRERAI
jgi:tetratricopeptide (TPR) repeat protein